MRHYYQIVDINDSKNIHAEMFGLKDGEKPEPKIPLVEEYNPNGDYE
jgi:hypothetical protein